MLEKINFDEFYEISKKSYKKIKLASKKLIQLLLFFDSVYLEDCDKHVVDLTVFHLYFAEVFDKVDHDLLLRRLMKMEIAGQFLCLQKSNLETGKEVVKKSNEKTDSLEGASGVPQGSNFRPLFFLIFIKELPDAYPELESYGFTDNFKLIAITIRDLNACA